MVMPTRFPVERSRIPALRRRALIVSAAVAPGTTRLTSAVLPTATRLQQNAAPAVSASASPSARSPRGVQVGAVGRIRQVLQIDLMHPCDDSRAKDLADLRGPRSPAEVEGDAHAPAVRSHGLKDACAARGIDRHRFVSHDITPGAQAFDDVGAGLPVDRRDDGAVRRVSAGMRATSRT